MNFLPQRRKKARMMPPKSDRVVSQGHLSFVRGFACSIMGRNGHDCTGKIEAHHVTTRGAGGGDDETVPLCSGAHSEGHTIGWETFERKYGVDLHAIARRLWQVSRHRIRWEQQHG